MSRQLRIEFPGAIFHVTSRGNERRNIVRDVSDCRRFVAFLAQVVTERRWLLHAWVLMSNHYHLLVETPEAGLSRGIKWLNQEYARVFNQRHDRVGHLFQGRFKSILVERETHLVELTRYIVLNPVRAGMVRQAADYPWSSYRATAGLRAVPPWLEVDTTLQRFGGDREEYRRFVANGCGSYNPWEAVIGQIYLGSPEFRARMQERVAAESRSGEHPRVQRTWRMQRLGILQAAVASAFEVPGERLLARGRGIARKALVHVAAEVEGLTLREIGRWLEVTKTAAANLNRAGQELYAVDAVYRERVDRIRAQLKG